MELTEELLNKELVLLTQEREKLILSMHHINGAISMTENLIKKLKTADKIIDSADIKKSKDVKSK